MVINAAAMLQANSILDYGCGKNTLLKALHEIMPGRYELRSYDPAITEYATLPADKADLLVCTDVLEHVELEKIDEVLAHMQSLTENAAVIVINIGPAVHKLPDGRNAHILQKPAGWWEQKIAGYFCVETLRRLGDETILVIGAPWSKSQADKMVAARVPSDADITADLDRKIAAAEGKVQMHGMLGSFKI